jgi:hypothetical protein
MPDVDKQQCCHLSRPPLASPIPEVGPCQHLELAGALDTATGEAVAGEIHEIER